MLIVISTFQVLQRKEIISDGKSRKFNGLLARSVLKHNSSSQNREEERFYSRIVGTGVVVVVVVESDHVHLTMFPMMAILISV